MIDIGELILAGFFFFTPVEAAPIEFSNSDIDDSVECLALICIMRQEDKEQ